MHFILDKTFITTFLKLLYTKSLDAKDAILDILLVFKHLR